MVFYLKEKGGKMHLYRQDIFFEVDLGELRKTSTGRLKTCNLLGENFELKDISGFFSQGMRYSIKSSKGLNEIIEKNFFGDGYTLR